MKFTVIHQLSSQTKNKTPQLLWVLFLNVALDYLLCISFGVSKLYTENLYDGI